MITGAHAIVYSRNAEKDRAFLRDVLGFSGVDVGGGWLIFGLPPAEIAVHPSDDNDEHELYLMCDDVQGFVAEMSKKKVACGAVEDLGWGLLTHLTLPGGGKLGVYQPRHARPPAWRGGDAAKKKKPAAARASASPRKRKPARRAAKAGAGKRTSSRKRTPGR
ncbi:MAG: extradiol dioxygenase [Acidobacteriota bacterium]